MAFLKAKSPEEQAAKDAVLAIWFALFVVWFFLGRMTEEADARGSDVRDCRVRGSEFGLADLRAINISCPDARRVYRKSLRVAAREYPNDDPTSFRHEGRRWTCRAKNPQREINGQYVDYIWRCVSGDRVVRYRWLAGD